MSEDRYGCLRGANPKNTAFLTRLVSFEKMADQTVDPVFGRLMSRFDSDIVEKVRAEMVTGGLQERGQVRIGLRITNNAMLNDVRAQLEDPKLQFRVCKAWSERYMDFGEIALARETMTAGQEYTSVMSGKSGTLARVTAELFLAECQRKEAMTEGLYYCSPMAVSRLLQGLHRIRAALESIFDGLSTGEQEENVWQILNCCKAVVDTAQPLVWYSCGKYVTETLVYAGLAMDTVINLCTARHMQLRMKLYISAFYSAAVHNTLDQAESILDALNKQLTELIEREELDEPVPTKTEDALVTFEMDMGVIRCVMAFLKEPESLEGALIFSGNAKYFREGEFGVSYAERCLTECMRMQDLTSGNTNEAWQRRSACLAKAFQSKLAADGDDAIVWTHQALTEVSSLVIFSRDEGDAAQILTAVKDRNGKQEEESRDGAVYSSTEFTIMHALAGIIFAEDVDDNVQFTALQEIVLLIEDVLHSDEFENRRSFLRRVVTALWQKYLYGKTQDALTRSSYASEESMRLLNGMVPAMIMAVRVLNQVAQQDPLFAGSVALLTVATQSPLSSRR